MMHVRTFNVVVNCLLVIHDASQMYKNQFNRSLFVYGDVAIKHFVMGWEFIVAITWQPNMLWKVPKVFRKSCFSTRGWQRASLKRVEFFYHVLCNDRYFKTVYFIIQAIVFGLINILVRCYLRGDCEFMPFDWKIVNSSSVNKLFWLFDINVRRVWTNFQFGYLI